MLNYTLVRFHGSRVPVLNKLVKIESHDVANNDDIRQLVQLYRTRSSASADGARSELLQKASKCNVFTVKKKLHTINEIFVNMHDIYYKLETFKILFGYTNMYLSPYVLRYIAVES